MTTHRAELLRVFKNTPADLAANRAGRLGPGQIARLRRGAVGAVALMVGLVAVLGALLLLTAVRPIQPWRWGLIAVLAAAGIAVGVYRGRQLRRAVAAGTVERLVGPIAVAMRGRSGWFLTVAGRSFHLPVRFWHVGPGLPYRVFVAPPAALVVAMEPVPDVAALAAGPVAFGRTGDAEHPFVAAVDGTAVVIRVNDFPAEPLYSVLVDGEHAGDLDDWPPAWTRPGLTPAERDLAAADPRGAALLAVVTPLGAAGVRWFAGALCAEPAPDTLTVLRALRLDGPLIDDLGVRRLATPVAGTSRTEVTETDGWLFTLRFVPAADPITRADLDAVLGPSRDLVRIHWDSDHRLAWTIRVDGATWACDVFASFREPPVAGSPAVEIVLRREATPTG